MHSRLGTLFGRLLPNLVGLCLGLGNNFFRFRPRVGQTLPGLDFEIVEVDRRGVQPIMGRISGSQNGGHNDVLCG
jgi:hypothetical protein